MRAHRFHPDALAEYEAAAAWYAQRSEAAALTFATRVDAAIESICALPEAWPLWPGRSDVRRRIVRRLPYSTIYVIDAEAIVIIAIAHHKRTPGYWLARLRR